MLYIPVCSIISSFLLGYYISGWSYASFWNVNLFCIMLTIASMQLGKSLCAIQTTYEAVESTMNIYLFLAAMVSGIFVNPRSIPIYLHWVIYLSISFWGLSGATLSILEHADTGEDQCSDFVTCIIFNRNFVAWFVGYGSVTTLYKSLISLCLATILLVLVEYYFLHRKISPCINHKMIKNKKQDTVP